VRRTPRNLAADHEAQAVAGRFTSQIALATHAAHQAANFNKLARKLANERAQNANGTAKRTEADALQRTADDLSRKNAELNEQAMASADKVDELNGLLHRANADNRAQGSKSKATHETRRLESEYQREVCVCAPADVTPPLRLPPRPLRGHFVWTTTATIPQPCSVCFWWSCFTCSSSCPSSLLSLPATIL
jgi:hypothetical protein